jgi:hypothetical protein
MELSKKYQKFMPEPEEFPGFPSEPKTNYWCYPRVVNGWWHTLTGAEQKVLDYILRHTWGYQKDCDKISYSQFEKGIFSKKENKWIDRGTGLPIRSIVRAIDGLTKKGFILKEGGQKTGKTNLYRLKVIGMPKG